MKTIHEVAAESTCQKRRVVCELLNDSGERLAIESNRCNPPDGTCVRIGIVSTREGYPVHSECNWTHAEIMALRAINRTAEKPFRAIIYGHNFPCSACELALQVAGVRHIELRQIDGVGLQEVLA
jgi:deoxycytidylate deaminase